MNLFENLQIMKENQNNASSESLNESIKIEPSNEVKKYWVYEEIIKAGYSIELTKDCIKVLFEDGTIYGNFNVSTEKDLTDDKIYYFASDDGQLLNYSFEDELPESYDELVKSTLYYFWTRY